MVTLSINLSKIELGPGVWKLNTSILPDPDYQTQVNLFWNLWKTKKQDFPSLTEWWDEGKFEIGRLTKSFCLTRKKRLLIKKSNLYKQLRNAKKKADLTSETRFFELVKNISHEIKTIESYEAKGMKIRA